VDRSCCCSTVGLWAVVAVAVGAPIVEGITTTVVVVVAVIVIVIGHDILDNLPPPVRRYTFAYYILGIPNTIVGGVKVWLMKTMSLVDVGVTLLGSGSGYSIGVKVWDVVAAIPIGRRECR
jgi:hypothetical protein